MFLIDSLFLYKSFVPFARRYYHVNITGYRSSDEYHSLAKAWMTVLTNIDYSSRFNCLCPGSRLLKLFLSYCCCFWTWDVDQGLQLTPQSSRFLDSQKLWSCFLTTALFPSSLDQVLIGYELHKFLRSHKTIYCPPSPHDSELPEVPTHLTVSLPITWCVILQG